MTKKLRNLYRQGLDVDTFKNATIADNWAVLRVVTEEDTQQRGSILLSAGAVEQQTGILLFQLVNAGGRFRETWNAKDGDVFLLSHLAGDRLGKFVFVEADDVLLKYGEDVFEG